MTPAGRSLPPLDDVEHYERQLAAPARQGRQALALRLGCATRLRVAPVRGASSQSVTRGWVRCIRCFGVQQGNFDRSTRRRQSGGSCWRSNCSHRSRGEKEGRAGSRRISCSGPWVGGPLSCDCRADRSWQAITLWWARRASAPYKSHARTPERHAARQGPVLRFCR
jgi:hypothetical protein